MRGLGGSLYRHHPGLHQGCVAMRCDPERVVATVKCRKATGRCPSLPEAADLKLDFCKYTGKAIDGASNILVLNEGFHALVSKENGVRCYNYVLYLDHVDTGVREIGPTFMELLRLRWHDINNTDVPLDI